MSDINFKREWKFIDLERAKIFNKKSLIFKLLDIAPILLLNYTHVKTKKEKQFYKIVYLKTKRFYLKEYQK